MDSDLQIMSRGSREPIGIGLVEKFWPSKIDGTTAPEWWMALDNNDLFVLAHSLRDFVRQDQRPTLGAHAAGSPT